MMPGQIYRAVMRIVCHEKDGAVELKRKGKPSFGRDELLARRRLLARERFAGGGRRRLDE